MRPVNTNDNGFYNDSLKRLTVGYSPSQKKIDSGRSNSSSSKGTYRRSKQGFISLPYVENTHMGFEGSYCFPNDNHPDYALKNNYSEGYTRQSASNSVYSSESTTDRHSHDNRSKGQPHDSGSCSQRNLSDGYFPFCDLIMDENPKMPELYGQPWTENCKSRVDSRKFSSQYSNSRGSNSNYSLPSIGATGLPRPIRPFHWIPSKRRFFTNSKRPNQKNTFLNAALARNAQHLQPQCEINYRSNIGAYPQAVYCGEGAPQHTQYQGSTTYNDKTALIGDYHNVLAEPPVACVEANSKLPPYGPIGTLGRIAAEKFYELKDSGEAAEMKERNIRLIAWCNWDILLDAKYIDSPRGLDELAEDKEEAQPEPDLANDSGNNVSVDRKHAAIDGASEVVHGMGTGPVQKKHTENSKFQKGRDSNRSDVRHCNEKASNSLEKKSNANLCLGSMMDLCNREERGRCEFQYCSEMRLANGTAALTLDAAKGAMDPLKNMRTLMRRRTSYDHDDFLIDSTLQESRLQQREPNAKKQKKHSITQKVKKLFNMISFGSMFHKSDEPYYFGSTDSDFLVSGSLWTANTDANNHSNVDENSGPVPAPENPVEVAETQIHSKVDKRITSRPPSRKKQEKSSTTKEIMAPVESRIKAEGCALSTVNKNYTSYARSSLTGTKHPGNIIVQHPNRNKIGSNEDEGNNNNSNNDSKLGTSTFDTTLPDESRIFEVRETETAKLAPESTAVDAPKRSGPTKLPALSSNMLPRPSSSSKTHIKKELVSVEHKAAGKPFTSCLKPLASQEKGALDKAKYEKPSSSNKPEFSTQISPAVLPKLSRTSDEPLGSTSRKG